MTHRLDFKDLLILREMIKKVARKTEGSYFLSEREQLALRNFNEVADLDEEHRLHLLELAKLAGLEPEQLVYLRRLAGLGVTAIEHNRKDDQLS